MRQSLLLSAVMLSALVLSGVALPVQSSETGSPVTQDQFTSGLDRLESSLTSRCDRQQLVLTDIDQRQAILGADIREVGSLLRQLRDEVRRQEIAPEIPAILPGECHADEDFLADKRRVGRTEWVGLLDVGTYLKARVDSGASTSSLSAVDVTTFERDGDDWVKFKLGLDDEDVAVDEVRDAWIEAPVERRVRIIQAAGEDSRPVISLMMSLGSIRQPVEFTLNDRTHLDYPVLLGRRFLMDIAIVDVAEAYLYDRPEFPGGRPSDEAQADQQDDDDQDDEEET